MVLFFSSKSSRNVAAAQRKSQRKGIIITGQVPGEKPLPALGLPWLGHLLFQQSQVSWQHAEKKANLDACLHLLSLFPALMKCWFPCPQCGKCLQPVLNAQLVDLWDLGLAESSHPGEFLPISSFVGAGVSTEVRIRELLVSLSSMQG